MKVKSESEVAQSCPTLSDPMDYSLPGSSVHGIFQAGVLGLGAIAFSLFRTLATPPNLVSATNTRCLFSTLSCGSLIKYLYKSFPINIFFWFPDCLGVLNWVHVLILSKNYTWLSELFADLWKKKIMIYFQIGRNTDVWLLLSSCKTTRIEFILNTGGKAMFFGSKSLACTSGTSCEGSALILFLDWHSF